MQSSPREKINQNFMTDKLKLKLFYYSQCIKEKKKEINLYRL